MIAATWIVIVAWVVLFCLISGLGELVRWIFRAKWSDFESGFMAFWIGYAVVIVVLHWWHLVLPIDWRSCLLLGALGALGFIWRRRPGSPHTRSSLLHIVLTLLILAPIAVWVANRALDTQLDFDTGLYHISTIHWLNAYRVVPGLGNLHYRLAFNQSFFMFVAMLNVYPFFNQGFHVANSLLVIVLVAQIVNNLVRTLLNPEKFSPYRFLSALFLPVLLYRVTKQPYTANISSPSPDLSVFLFQVVVILEFAKMLFEGGFTPPIPLPRALTSDSPIKRGRGDLPDNRHENDGFARRQEIGDKGDKGLAVFFIIVMSVVGVTSKLSFIVFGLTLIGLSLALWFYRERGALTLALRDAALWLIVAGTLIGLPWMINGILTSGYPVFPSTIGALPVDYRIPTAVTKDAADWIISFARSPHQDETITLTSWDWIPVWWGNTQDPFLQFLFVFPFLFALLSLYFYVGLLIIFRKYRPPADRRLWLILIPGITSGIFWFVSAPDPRFAGATFWILALWGGILLSTLGQKKASRWSITLALVIPAIVGLVLVGIQPRTEFDLSNKGFPDLPVAPIRTFTTDSGLVVNMPADDNNDLQLWDMPQPASPYEIPGLELRGNTLQDGFRTRPNP